MTEPIKIITFGFLHGPAPEAHLTLDLRHHFRDPHVDPRLRHMTAHDEPVRAAVLGTSGIVTLVTATVTAASAFLAGPTAGPLTVAVGCAGGRHRAAAVGIALCRLMGGLGVSATLQHRDLAKPVVERPAAGELGGAA